MRLTRDNNNPRVLDDLERLNRRVGPADREPQPLLAERPPAAVEAAVEEEAGGADPYDDPFVHRFVQASVHAKRYAPFYAGAFAFFLAMILIQPVGHRGGGSDEAFAQTPQRSRVVATSNNNALTNSEPDTAAAPTFDNFGASSVTSSGGAFNSDAEAEFGASPIRREPTPSTGETDFPSTPGSSFSDEVDDDTPEPLEITASGYASRTGGTPLEQVPANGGLPVSSAGGQEVKRSFIRLSGDELILRLQLDPSAQNVADVAAIKACPITDEDWSAKPNQAYDASPAFGELCANGTPGADGVWTFDLTEYAPISKTNGFALVAAAGNPTFNVVFKPQTVPAA
jgi:hypothetical protein